MKKRFLQWLKGWLRDQRVQFLPILTSLAFSFMTMALLFVALLILASPEKLGALYWPALLVYLGAIAAAAALLYHRRELREFRALVGEEEFFRIYPRIQRREARRKARKARKQNKNRKDPD